MTERLKEKLEFILQFQKENKNSHVGGSIGLFIRGINLQRNLDFSDLDFVTDELSSETKDKFRGEIAQSSDARDFDYALRVHHNPKFYTKVDIRLSSEDAFDVVEFDGNLYNVSRFEDILKWKNHYANKGVTKHIDDLITIDTGVRPVFVAALVEDDGLPF